MDHDDYISEGYAIGWEFDEEDGYFEESRDWFYNERRAKTAETRRIREAVQKELEKHGLLKPKQAPRGAKVEVSCLCCKTTFMARVADRKRGWARYCSKSCKAKRQ